MAAPVPPADAATVPSAQYPETRGKWRIPRMMRAKPVAEHLGSAAPRPHLGRFGSRSRVDLTVGPRGDKRGTTVTDPNATAATTRREPSSSSMTGSQASSAGRGGIAVAIAKMYFLVIGLVQQILLTRALGTAGYGALSTALSIAAVVYNPIVTTSIQGMSRTIARADEPERPAVVRRVLSLHAGIALSLAALFASFAEPIVRLVHSPHLITPVRILAAVLFFYGLYAPLIGVMNGSRRFIWQASFDMVYATLRTALMVGGAMFVAKASGQGVIGATMGFAAAAALIFVGALSLTGVGSVGSGAPSTKEYFSFVGPVFIGQVLLNLLQQADLTILRYFAATSAIHMGQSPELADPLVGAYRATQLFCFLPYQLLLSITFVLFPLLAKAHRDQNIADVRVFVMTGVRLALVIAGTMVAVISGLSGPLLRLVFPSDVAVHATDAMQLLALGFGAFAIFGILTTVLTSLKAERISALVTGLAFVMVAIAGSVLLHRQPFGSGLLLRTASATSFGLVAATLVAAYLVHRLAGGVASMSTLLRVGIATTVTIALGRFWSPSGKLATLVAAAVLGTSNLVLLALMQELNRRDLAQVLAIVGKRRSR